LSPPPPQTQQQQQQRQAENRAHNDCDVSMAADKFVGSELGLISIIAANKGKRGSSRDFISLTFKNKDGPI